ncbi:MAG: hypothetical protein HXY29_14880, partial [Rhodocyclaceae bacterium]|nr:hypothetical protein [Rhodocyclaceae bacterium]
STTNRPSVTGRAANRLAFSIISAAESRGFAPDSPFIVRSKTAMVSRSIRLVLPPQGSVKIVGKPAYRQVRHDRLARCHRNDAL